MYLFTLTDEDQNCTTVECYCNTKSAELSKDRIVITDKNLLPVTGFTYGPFTSQNATASVEVKKLECYTSAAITRNDCQSIQFVNTTRLQFYMEYVNNKDCYAEVEFPAEVDLKLTVSNFKVSTIFSFSLKKIITLLNPKIF